MKRFKPYYLLMLSLVVMLFFSWKNSDNQTNYFRLQLKQINSIVIDDKGIKWIATEEGLLRFDGMTWTNYPSDESLNKSIAILAVDLLSDIKKFWMGTNVGLTSLENSPSLSIVNYNTTNSGILSDSVTALGIDRSNVKYIGTSKGLSILKNNTWDIFYGRKTEEILSQYKISSVAAASNGFVYATTLGGGVSRFKYTDAVSGATTYNQPWAWGLPSDYIHTVYVDGIAQWYGTNRGIAYHSSEYTKDDWTTYTKADGLVCDSVYAIAKDSLGNVWFGTHNGISRFNIDSTWTSYTTKDGLIANKINTIAADIDGSVWFGTDKGISHYINSKWVNYQEVPTSMKFHEISPISLFSVYPNPVKDQIRIMKTDGNSRNMSIEIRSISGVLLISGAFSTQNQIIDIADLTAGVYLLTVTSENKTQTIQIIKQ